jgi:ubiquinone/menaquinone biosynthesis C-methylase UbiE
MTTGVMWSDAFASAGAEAAQAYDGIMVPRLFDPWAGLLLDQLAPKAGDALLDVACGTGAVARRAAARIGPTGRVTGCDMSPAMLAMARAKPQPDASAPIDYAECPADALSVPESAYDIVTCQQGLQFFGDRQRSLNEMRRALRPGGRLGVAVWSAIDQSPPFAALAAAVTAVLGEQAGDAYRNGPWGLASTDVAALAGQAGFAGVYSARHRLPLVFDGGPKQLLQTLAATALAADVAALGEAGQHALLHALEDAVAPLMQDGEIRSHAAAQLTITSKP